MTECGPLIAYADWTDMRTCSCGKVVDRMEVGINSNDPINEVGESLVIEKGGKLYAFVYPDFDMMKSTGIDDKGFESIYEKFLPQTNEHLPSYMKVSRIVLHPDEFEKTPK